LAPFDPVTGRLGRITVGWISAIAPWGGEALGLDTNQDLVYPVELTDDHVGKPIRVGHSPVAVAFSPDGHTAYVANAGTAAYAAMPSVGGPIGNRPSNTVTPINLMTNHPGRPIPVCDGPTALALSADSRTLVVTCGEHIALVNTVTDRLERVLEVGPYPWGIVAISPSGKEAVVGETQVGHGVIGSGDLLPIDLLTGTAGPLISIGGNNGDGGALALVFAPHEDRYVYATTGRWMGSPSRSNEVVLRVDLDTGRVAAPLMLNGQPVSYVHFWPNGDTGYVASLVTSNQPDRYRVGLSLRAPGRLIHLTYIVSFGGSGFAAQAPYFLSWDASREITVVDLASGGVRVIPVPFFSDEVRTG
jgi:DNA-binding beta-propeller fold protein YncE